MARKPSDAIIICSNRRPAWTPCLSSLPLHPVEARRFIHPSTLHTCLHPTLTLARRHVRRIYWDLRRCALRAPRPEAVAASGPMASSSSPWCQTIKATKHPKVALGIVALLASPLLLVSLAIGGGGEIPHMTTLAAAAAAAPPPEQDQATPPPPIPSRDLPEKALTTDLCISAASLHHVHMMEQMIRPSYAEVLGALADLPQGTWLQIGANTLDDKDGKDPLKEWLDVLPGAWNKVFVEPIPAVFAKLERSLARYANATAVNVAISPTADVPESQAEMYCLKEAFESDNAADAKGIGMQGRSKNGGEADDDDEDALPYWADQICSFSKSHIAKHFPDKETTTVTVTAWSLPELLRQQGIRDVEVLVIDTEGLDLRVLEQIPFADIRPRLILYEHQHLSDAEQEAAELLLRGQCYTVWELDGDNHAALALYV